MDCFRCLSNEASTVAAQVTFPPGINTQFRSTGYAIHSPLLNFLTRCHERFKEDNSGALADYIPELQKADPAQFGISLVTIDGHIYEVGDSWFPFTIHSIARTFVFALALEMARA